jgi:hypothetical protein
MFLQEPTRVFPDIHAELGHADAHLLLNRKTQPQQRVPDKDCETDIDKSRFITSCLLRNLESRDVADAHERLVNIAKRERFSEYGGFLVFL